MFQQQLKTTDPDCQQNFNKKQYCYLCALDSQGNWMGRIKELPEIIVRETTLEKIEQKLNKVLDSLSNQGIKFPPPDKYASSRQLHMLVVSLDKLWANRIN